MKTISVLVFALGILFAVGSFIRYYIFFPDTDKALAYCLIGLLFIGWAWNNNKIRTQEATLEGVEEYLADKR